MGPSWVQFAVGARPARPPGLAAGRAGRWRTVPFFRASFFGVFLCGVIRVFMVIVSSISVECLSSEAARPIRAAHHSQHGGPWSVMLCAPCVYDCQRGQTLCQRPAYALKDSRSID